MVLFPPAVYTVFHILTLKQRKHDLKYFLVINIISLDMHFKVRTQRMNFKFTKMTSQGESHTWNYLQCSMFSKQKQLSPSYTTATTWNKLSMYAVKMITYINKKPHSWWWYFLHSTLYASAMKLQHCPVLCNSQHIKQWRHKV